MFAPTFGILLALRFVQGLGAASSRVIAMSAIRDTYHGREMASVISLTFMVFMVIPILAPSVGQGLLLVGSWHTIFAFMAGLAAVIGLWAYLRLPETLHPEFRRDLTVRVIAQGFAAVVSNRSAFLYGLCGMLFFASMFGFLVSSQQIFVGIYGLGAMFPLAFASVALVMAGSNFINSRIVGHFGMRRVGHFAMLVYIACATTILVLALIGPVPFWVYFVLLAGQQSVFGWATSNMNSLSMEPLGRVAGTAAAVFGFMQTVGGAIIGTFIGQLFNGTLVPVAAASATLGGLILVCVLIAEKGKLFGVGAEYQPAPGMAD